MKRVKSVYASIGTSTKTICKIVIIFSFLLIYSIVEADIWQQVIGILHSPLNSM